jgi:membrane associated rhomboid family serine protease
VVEFAPLGATDRPWSFFTYMFVHGGLLHLLANSIALFVFGPPVERRLGSSLFILFYLYCGVGAAVFSMVATFIGFKVGPFVGASGAILGVALAFARTFPDAELMIFPLPVPIKAKYLILIMAAIDVVGAVSGSGNIAHTAHLGGMASAWLFFALQGITRPAEPQRLPSMRPRVPVPHRENAARAVQPDRSPATNGNQPATPAADPVATENAELDRLLDKISASGIDSLSADERRFLDGVSRRRKGGAG